MGHYLSLLLSGLVSRVIIAWVRADPRKKQPPANAKPFICLTPYLQARERAEHRSKMSFKP
jgi:hypothetical protein